MWRGYMPASLRKRAAPNTNGYVTTAASENDTITNQSEGLTTVVGSVDIAENPNEQTTKDVVYTNRRDSVAPTGVIMIVAPYVLMVVIAAAGCFVFLRKRRDD